MSDDTILSDAALDNMDRRLETDFDTEKAVEENPFGATEAIEDALVTIRALRARVKDAEAKLAEVEAERDEDLLDWIGYHHMPLEIFRDVDTGLWVVADASEVGTVWGSGETPRDALTAARAALKDGEDRGDG